MQYSRLQKPLVRSETNVKYAINITLLYFGALLAFWYFQDARLRTEPEKPTWTAQTGCKAWDLVLHDVDKIKSAQCSVIESAIRNKRVIHNFALGVDLSRRPDDAVLTLLRPVIESMPFAVMVDVGANDGQLSVQALQRYKTLRSFLFEPSPATCARLLNNLDLHGVVDRSVLVCTAATKSSEALELRFDNASTSNAVAVARDSGAGILGVAVDEIVPNNLNVALFKTDTQGFEWNVLEGSKNLLAGRNVQAIIVEVSYVMTKKSGLGGAARLLDKIMSLGYVCTTMDWRGVVSKDTIDGHRFGAVETPLLPLTSFSPEELQQALAHMGPYNYSGWTDVLCVPS